jgi:hypothetical protein
LGSIGAPLFIGAPRLITEPFPVNEEGFFDPTGFQRLFFNTGTLPVHERQAYIAFVTALA